MIGRGVRCNQRLGRCFDFLDYWFKRARFCFGLNQFSQFNDFSPNLSDGFSLAGIEFACQL